jgi:hypothetical protein
MTLLSFLVFRLQHQDVIRLADNVLVDPQHHELSIRKLQECDRDIMKLLETLETKHTEARQRWVAAEPTSIVPHAKSTSRNLAAMICAGRHPASLFEDWSE